VTSTDFKGLQGTSRDFKGLQGTLRDFFLVCSKGFKRNQEASPKITAQLRTIYVTAQSAPTAGAAESADSP
jgi:hypothetical protein